MLPNPRLAPWVLLVLLGPGLARAQTGAFRATGTVTDLDDRPVSGAEVALRSTADPTTRPIAGVTGSDGRWSLEPGRSGRWEITVKARDYRTSKGWLDILPNGPTAPVAVALRPLDEVTPIFGTSSQSVSNWIEMGNDLLEQGHAERARQEYSKALEMLPVDSRPEVLRAVARTHYLQGELEPSIETLEQALLIEPDDEVTRQLYLSVASQLGKVAEAESFLSALPEGGELTAELPPTVGRRAVPTDQTRMNDLPTEPALAGRTGRFRVRFTDPSPVGDLSVLVGRLGVGLEYVMQNDPLAGQYLLPEESFQVYVPERPAPPQGYGLWVWISPLPFGGFLREEVREVLDSRDLIWIGADRSGNDRLLWYRIRLALDAVHNMKPLYVIDPDRIYAAGYSGGGRVTSTLAQLYPEVFRGGFSFFGCDYWRPVPIPHMAGAPRRASFATPSPDVLQQVQQTSRFVLLTGELDFNRSQSRATFDQMLDDGFQHVELLVIPGASHYHTVENEWIERGIDFLDRATGR